MQVLLQEGCARTQPHPTPSRSVTRQMTGHKLKEPAMDDMINVLHMSKVKHVNVMRVLKEQVGGQESMNITERDIQNRYIQNCWIIV